MALDNPYDDVVDEMLNGTKSRASPEVVRDSLTRAQAYKPDEEALLLSIQRETGAPVEAFRKDPEPIKAQVKASKVDTAAMAPPLANKLATDDYFARISQDDLDPLEGMAGVIPMLMQGAQFAGKVIAAGTTGALSGLYGTVMSIKEGGPLGEYGKENAVRQAAIKPWQGQPRYDVGKDAAYLSAQSEKLTPKTGNTIVDAGIGGLVSMAQQAPAMALAIATKQPGVALATMGVETYGQGYSQAREAGKDPATARRFGYVQGGVEVATEMTPTLKLLNDTKLGASLGKTILNNIIHEMPGEQIATILQDAEEQAVLHPEKSWMDYLKDRPEAAIKTAVGVIVQGGASSAMTHMTQSVVDPANKAAGRMAVRDDAADTALNNAPLVEKLTKMAQASKVRQRDPQSFKQFVAEASEDGPVTDLYVPAEQLAQAMAEKPEAPPVAKAGEEAQTPPASAQDALAAMVAARPELQQEIAEAAAIGGDVRIPIEDWATHLADSALGQSLLDHVKTDPTGMSKFQAEEYIKSHGETFRAEVETAMAGAVDAELIRNGAEMVKTHFQNQLIAANRFTPDVNEAYASMLGGFYATGAKKLGITPEEMLVRYPLQIKAQNVAGPSLEQGESREAMTTNIQQVAAANGVRAEFNPHAQIGSILEPQIELTDFYADTPGQGGGTKTMQALAAAADAQDVNIYVHPESPRAKEFFSRFGFEASGRPGMMVRYPPLPDLEQGARPKLTPAVKFNGKIYRAQPGQKTHLDVWFDNIPKEDRTFTLDGGTMGYIDHRGRFIQRQRAMEYARENNLVDPRYASYATTAKELPSEWLAEDSLFQDNTPAGYDPGLGFHSKVAEAVRKGPGKGNADQWLATIKNLPGVKKEEIEWLGLEEALRTMGEHGPITKDQVVAYVEENGVRLEEVVQGETSEREIEARREELQDEWLEANEDDFDADYEEVEIEDADGEDEDEDGNSVPYWIVEGVEYGDYAEAQKAAEEENETRRNAAFEDQRGNMYDAMPNFDQQAREELEGTGVDFADWKLPGGDNYREVLLTLPTGRAYSEELGTELDIKQNPRLGANFTASHWSAPNVVAHTRLTDRRGAEGKRVLFVEEIQSDWHQKGREEGYAKVAKPEDVAAAEEAWNAAKAERDAAILEFGERVYELMGAAIPLLEAEQTEAVRVLDQRKTERDAALDSGDEAALRDTQEKYWDAKNKADPDLYAGLKAVKEDRSRLGIYLAEGDANRTDTNTTRFMIDARYWPDDTEFRRQRNDLREQHHAEVAPLNLNAREAENNFERLSGSKGIPDAPFKSSWPALMMKRVIRMALDGGYDRIAWTTGQQQIDRYDLGAATGDVSAEFHGEDKLLVQFGNAQAATTLLDNGAADVAEGFSRYNVFMTRAQAVAALGNETGGKLYDEAKASGASRMEASDITVGGDGMRGFYDRNLVNITNDIVKKFGAKVQPVQITLPGKSGHEVAQIQEQIADRQQRAEYLENEAVIGLTPGYRQTMADEAQYARESAARYAEELAKARPIQPGFDITPQMRESYEPALFQEQRGAFSPATSTITLLKAADLSTFIHEAGHFFLETMADMASQPGAPQDIHDDMNAILRWFGVADIGTWKAMTLDEQRENHEKFARGFEAYTMEGNAPSQELRSVFQRFRSWLLNIYKRVTALNVRLNDDVRQVFDRMLATDEQITEAQAARAFGPMFASAEEAGMSPLEWTAYQKLGEQATADAQDELQTRSLRDMKWLGNAKDRMIRKLQSEAKARRKLVKAEVTTEVMGERINRLRTFLKRGLLDGQPVDGPFKLSITEVQELYGKQDYEALGYGKYGMLAKADSETGAMHPEQVAELFGYSSGDEMILDLLTGDDAKAKIDGMTDRRMLERYGDLTDEDAIDRAADEAIHNDARLRFAATEANALAKAAGKPKLLATAARDFAKQMIARQRVRDVKPGRYAAAEQRAFVKAQDMMRAGKLAEAAAEKRNQVINGYAAKAAFNTLEEIDKAVRYFKKFDNEGTRKNLDASYRDQIDALLERYDLRTGQSLKAIDRRTSLAEWVEAQQALGFDPTIDDKLLNDASRTHYKNLTVEELRGVVDAVRNIEHLGRLKHRLLTAKDKREFALIVDDAEAMIVENGGRPRAVAIERNGWMDDAKRGVVEFFASHRKFASLIREMSGLQDGGILWETLVRPMNAAADREATMRADATKALHTLFAPVASKKELMVKRYIPEIGTSLSLQGRMAVALNWGNEINRARIMDGDKWTMPQVQAVLSTLTAQEWQFVQGVWDYLDTFRPLVGAKERRVTGSEPEWVTASPFNVTTADGQTLEMQGGYYPIKYDPERSTKSDQNEVAEQIKQTLQGSYTRATTRRGHTKARVDTVRRPVRKDLGVVIQHVTEVVHDLAWHEYLIDATRLLRAPQIDGAIRDHYGPETLRQMTKALNDMAAGDVGAQNVIEKWMLHARAGATIAGLGWNLTSALLQPTGLMQSAVRIGPKWVLKGAGRWMRDAAALQNTVAWMTTKSEFMASRALTMQREISEIRNRIRGKSTFLQQMEGSMFYLTAKMQLVADVPTWIGAYEKAVEGGNDDSTAIALADQAVRDSQGGGSISDLAGVQRGGAALKLWTNFYSFFNVAYNQLAESASRFKRVGAANLPMFAADVFLVAMLPQMMTTIIRHAMSGDDWDLEELLKKIGKDQIGFAFGLMIGLREVGAVLTEGRYSAPTALRVLVDAGRFRDQLKQGDIDGAWLKAANNLGGVLFHYPAGQINKTVSGIHALATGETDNWLAPLVGPPKKSNR